MEYLIILLCLEEAGGPRFKLHYRPGGCSLHFFWEFIAVERSLGLLLQSCVQACSSALISSSVARASAVKGGEPEALRLAEIPEAPAF